MCGCLRTCSTECLVLDFSHWPRNTPRRLGVLWEPCDFLRIIAQDQPAKVALQIEPAALSEALFSEKGGTRRAHRSPFPSGSVSKSTLSSGRLPLKSLMGNSQQALGRAHRLCSNRAATRVNLLKCREKSQRGESAYLQVFCNLQRKVCVLSSV
jgi:hypothetical protein